MRVRSTSVSMNAFSDRPVLIKPKCYAGQSLEFLLQYNIWCRLTLLVVLLYLVMLAKFFLVFFVFFLNDIVNIFKVIWFRKRIVCLWCRYGYLSAARNALLHNIHSRLKTVQYVSIHVFIKNYHIP